MKVACRPAREPRLPATTPVRRGMGKGVGGRETRPGGERPAAPPRARRRRRRLRRVSLSPPGPPRHVPRGGPEGSAWVPRGVWGLPRAPPPPPNPAARGAGHDRLSPTPARGPRAARVLRSRLAGCAARRAAASPSRGRSPRPVASRAAGPGPVCLGRSSSVVPPPWARRAVAGRLPAPLRAAGLCPAPAPTPHASRRLVGLRPGSPALSTPPLPAGRQASRRSPCPLPAAPSVVVAAGGRVPGNAGAGRGAPPTPGGWGREDGGGPAGPGPYGAACEGAAVGKEGSAPFRGDGWGWPSGARRWGPPGGGRPARGGGPPCVTGRQRRGPRAAAGGDAAVGGRRRGGGPRGRAVPLARLPLSRYLARPGAEV